MEIRVMCGTICELRIEETKETWRQKSERFLQYWRNASRQEDPGYYKAIDAAYNQK